MLVHVSAEPRNVTVVSFPRDLMVPVPTCEREDGSTASAMTKQPLNSVFQHAGLSCVAKTIGDLAEMPIEFAAKISFDGVMAITDDIGGVEVCISGDGIRDRQAGIDWPPGTRTVAGEDALKFLRTRHGVGDESDLARISNQQQYMSRLAKKVLSDEVLSDVPTVMRLADTIADNIVPSVELANPVRLPQLALALNDVPFSDFAFVQYPNADDPDNPGIKVVPNHEAAAGLWAALRAGQPIQLTGDVATNDGVELVAPAPPDAPQPTATGTPEARATLSPDVSGQTLEQETCSVGNLR